MGKQKVGYIYFELVLARISHTRRKHVAPDRLHWRRPRRQKPGKNWALTACGKSRIVKGHDFSRAVVLEKIAGL
jgi:hypothetical protein